MLRALYEDILRHMMDSRTNRQTVNVLDPQTRTYVERQWHTLRTGEVIRLHSGAAVPADCLLLSTSEPNGSCFAETADLDGETNLKHRFALPLTAHLNTPAACSAADLELVCGGPSRDLYSFSGSLAIPPPDGSPPGTPPRTTAVGIDQMLLRGMVLRKAHVVNAMVVFTGKDTRVMQNATPASFKRSRVEALVNKLLLIVVAFQVLICVVSCVLLGVFTQSAKVVVDTAPSDEAPTVVPGAPPGPLGPIDVDGAWYLRVDTNPYEASLLGFLTFLVLYNNLIPISLYVSIEVVKLFQGYMMRSDRTMWYAPKGASARTNTTALNEELGQVNKVFVDKTGTLTCNVMAFFKFSCYGEVYGVGETEIARTLAAKQLAPTVAQPLPVVGAGGRLADSPHRGSGRSAGATAAAAAASTDEFPYDEFVDGTMSGSATFSGTRRVGSPSKGDAPTPGAGRTRSGTPRRCAGGDAARVDKGRRRVGRLAAHKAVGPNRAPAGPGAPGRARASPPDNGVAEFGFVDDRISNGQWRFEPRAAQIEELFIALAVCHTVIIEADEGAATTSYSAESPDEAALVRAMHLFGISFTGRTPDSITFRNGSLACTYDVLAVNEFDSDRKRMSVLVRDSNGVCRILCKGADNAMVATLAEGDPLINITQEQTDRFAADGLRTLMVASRFVSEEEAAAFAARHTEAKSTPVPARRQHLLSSAAHAMERGLTLLGSTGIEDKLQDNVSETIASLRDSGMVVWMLTGDKTETAVNIAAACSLSTPDTRVVRLTSGMTASELDSALQAAALDMKRLDALAAAPARIARVDASHQRSFAEANPLPTADGSPMDAAITSPVGSSAAHGGGGSSSAHRRSDGAYLSPGGASGRPSSATRRSSAAPTTARLGSLAPTVPGSRRGSVAVSRVAGASRRDSSGTAIGGDRNNANATTTSAYAAAAKAPTEWGLVIDGAALDRVLFSVDVAGVRTPRRGAEDRLWAVVSRCACVIACRVSPIQKAQVVELVKARDPLAVTLAIGDGANDVSMIRAAHVGIGISGQEGQQAANSSDYVICQFRFLSRLLFIHGHWNYRRVSRLILYSFYKNAVLYLTQFCFVFFNGFSGQSLYDSWSISLFNVIFTVVPILVVAILDRDLEPPVLTRNPIAYAITGAAWSDINFTEFLKSAALSLWHAALCFFIPVLFAGGFGDSDVWPTSDIRPDGRPLGLVGQGAIMYTCVMWVVTLRLAIQVQSWTWVHHLAFFGSMLVWYGFLVVYGEMSVFGYTYFQIFAELIISHQFFLVPLFVSVFAIGPLLALRYYRLQVVDYCDMDPKDRLLLRYEMLKEVGANVLNMFADQQKGVVQSVGSDKLSGVELADVALVRERAAVRTRKGRSGAYDSDEDDGVAGANESDDDDYPVVAPPMNPVAEGIVKEGALYGVQTGDSEDAEQATKMTTFLLTFHSQAMERRFLLSYYAQLDRFRIALFVAVVFSGLLGIFTLVQWSDNEARLAVPVAWFTFSAISLVMAALFWLRWQWFRSRMHPTMTILTSLVFLTCIVAHLVPASCRSHTSTMVTVILGILALMRPPFYASLLYCGIALAFYLFAYFTHEVIFVWTQPTPVRSPASVAEWLANPSQTPSPVDFYGPMFDTRGLLARFLEIALVAAMGLQLIWNNERSLRMMFAADEILKQKSKILKDEESRSLVLLRNVLPRSIVPYLAVKGVSPLAFSHTFAEGSAVASDIVRFTDFSSSHDAFRVIEMLNRMFSKFDRVTELLDLEKIKTIGDAYIATGGVPRPDPFHRQRIADLGLLLVIMMRETAQELGYDLSIRVGIASGPLTAGIVGQQKLCYDVFGPCISAAERMEQTGRPDRVHVDPVMRKALQSEYGFDEISGPHGVQYFLDPKRAPLGRAYPPTGNNVFYKKDISGDDLAAYLGVDTDTKAKSPTYYLWESSSSKPIRELQHPVTLRFHERAIEQEYRAHMIEREHSMRPKLLTLGACAVLFFPFVLSLLHDTKCSTPPTWNDSPPPPPASSDKLPIELLIVLWVLGLLQTATAVVANWYHERIRGRLLAATDEAVFAVPDDTMAEWRRLAAVGRLPTVRSDGTLVPWSEVDSLPPNVVEPDGASITASFSLAANTTPAGAAAAAHAAHAAEDAHTQMVSDAHAAAAAYGDALTANGALTRTPRESKALSATTSYNAVAAAARAAQTSAALTAFLKRRADTLDAVSRKAASERRKWEVGLWLTSWISIGAALVLLPVLLLVIPNSVVGTLMSFFQVAILVYLVSHSSLSMLPRMIVLVVWSVLLLGCYLLRLAFWDEAVFASADILALVVTALIVLLATWTMERAIRSAFATERRVQCRQIQIESTCRLSDVMLLNVLPQSVLRRMRTNANAIIIDRVEHASVLFCYFDGLTSFDDATDAVVGMRALNSFLKLLDGLTVKFNVEKVKTSPYLVVSGCPEARDDHAESLFLLAVEFHKVVAAYRDVNAAASELRMKVGIHSGRLSSGILGTNKWVYDIFGDTVNVAARLTSSCAFGSLQVSESTHSHVQHLASFEPRGAVQLKGKGLVNIFTHTPGGGFVDDAAPARSGSAGGPHGASSGYAVPPFSGAAAGAGSSAAAASGTYAAAAGPSSSGAGAVSGTGSASGSARRGSADLDQSTGGGAQAGRSSGPNRRGSDGLKGSDVKGNGGDASRRGSDREGPGLTTNDRTDSV